MQGFRVRGLDIALNRGESQLKEPWNIKWDMEAADDMGFKFRVQGEGRHITAH